MKKFYLKILIASFIILVLVFLVVVFLNRYHYRRNNNVQNNIFDKSQSNTGYYSTSTKDGERIVDPSTDFSFLVPNGWNITKIAKSMVILSFSPIQHSKNNDSEDECRIIFQSSKIPSSNKYNLNTVKNYIQKTIVNSYPKFYKLKFVTSTLSGYEAIQVSFNSDNTKDSDEIFIIDILKQNNLFDFSGLFSGAISQTQKNICENSTHNIIKTIKFGDNY